METIRVGIREFRDKLSSFVLESEAPVAITRHGDTVGYFIPTRRRRSETDRSDLMRAAARIQASMAAQGVTEDEILADFQQWRASELK